MAIDYGTRRIGVAFSESDLLSSPHSVVPNDGNVISVISRLASLSAELGADRIVLGIPRSIKPNIRIENQFAKLAALLQEKSGREVLLWNEAFTTTEATSLARSAGKKRKQLKNEIDMRAAAVILQSFLDEEQVTQ